MALGQRFDVVALGELVIDLVPEHRPDGRMAFAPKPGGAPGNVAVGVARLGGRAAMLSKVGDDAFGRLLIETLRGRRRRRGRSLEHARGQDLARGRDGRCGGRS